MPQDPADKARQEKVRHAEKLRRVVDESAEADRQHEVQQRNAGVAIGLLALVVVLLLIALVSGATDVFRP